GELTNIITTARNRVRKVYEVKVKGIAPEDAIERLRRGVTLDDGVRTAPAEIKRVEVSESNSWFEVVLLQGRNQQIRRMFDVIGHSVVKLRRTKIGFLSDEGLKPGHWRFLTPAEVARLKKMKQATKKAAKKRPAGHASG
ncbi:MAG TPA: pseudouridine synthase, partial [Pyrinomonadaceae bacterium]